MGGGLWKEARPGERSARTNWAGFHAWPAVRQGSHSPLLCRWPCSHLGRHGDLRGRQGCTRIPAAAAVPRGSSARDVHVHTARLSSRQWRAVHSPRCALRGRRGPGRHLVQPAAILQREAEGQGRLQGGRGLPSPRPAHRWAENPQGPWLAPFLQPACCSWDGVTLGVLSRCAHGAVARVHHCVRCPGPAASALSPGVRAGLPSGRCAGARGRACRGPGR